MTLGRFYVSPVSLLAFGISLCLALTMFLSYKSYSTNQALQRAVDRNEQLAAQVHDTQCAYRASLVDQQNQAHEFLGMTPAERVEAFGTVLGAIPESVVHQQMDTRQTIIDAIDSVGLMCGR